MEKVEVRLEVPVEESEEGIPNRPGESSWGHVEVRGTVWIGEESSLVRFDGATLNEGWRREARGFDSAEEDDRSEELDFEAALDALGWTEAELEQELFEKADLQAK